MKTTFLPLSKLYAVLEICDDVEIILGYTIGEPQTKTIRDTYNERTFSVLWVDGNRVYVKEAKQK